MPRDKKGNPTIPKWDFNKLKKIYVAGVRASYIKMYTYKESKRKVKENEYFKVYVVINYVI